MKEIKIRMDTRMINDFRGYAGEAGFTAASLIKKWIEDYVANCDRQDIKYLQEKRKILTPEQSVL